LLKLLILVIESKLITKLDHKLMKLLVV